jgi:hypothetical protein
MAILRTSKGKKSKKHLLLDVHGSIGGIMVVRQFKDKIVISGMPSKSRKKPTAIQKDKRQRFRYAVKYALMVLKNPAERARYQNNLNGKRNVYQAALSDYLRSQA